MDLIQTPIETYSLKGIDVDVKRDDLVGDGDIFPRWSKIEGIRRIMESDYINKNYSEIKLKNSVVVINSKKIFFKK